MQISVKKPNGKSISLEVRSSDTVDKLKAMVRDKEGFPRDEQKLFFGRNRLEDAKTLSHYKILKNSTLELVLRSLRVSVKKSNGSISLDVKSSDTIYMVKAMVQDREGEGFHPDNQRLFFQGKELEDKRTMAYYNIQRKSSLVLKIRSSLVFVKKPNGKSIALEIKSSDTIEKLKAMVREKEGFPRDDQRIYFKGKEVEDRNTLEHYHITNESTVTLELVSRRVYVKKKSNGDSFSLEVKSSDTVYLLRAKIQDREGFAPYKQNLFFEKKQLEGKRTLAYYKIRKDSVLELELR